MASLEKATTENVAPYGKWTSEISAEVISKGSIQFSDILIDPITSAIHHLESRPSEEGRTVLVNTLTGIDLVGPGWNVRTGVQEYGGAAAIVYNKCAYFSHFNDNRVYLAGEGNQPKPITSENTFHRFAGFVVHPLYSYLLVSILEDHTIDLPTVPSSVATTLVVINTINGTMHTFVKGADFYASPKFSIDGKRITWLQWSHPDMPWEGSEIHVADVVVGSDSLSIENDLHIAGKRSQVSAAYPLWAPNNNLVFTCDQSGYINPFQWKHPNGPSEPALSEHVPIEFGIPLWQFQESTSAIIDYFGRFALFSGILDSQSDLYLVDLKAKSEPKSMKCPYVVINFLRTLSNKDHSVVFVGQKVDEGSCIVQCTILDLLGSPSPIYSVIKSSPSLPFSKEMISVPKSMSLHSGSGDLIHVIYYEPRNPNYTGSSIVDELPPCIVNVHGGPTGQSMKGLNWEIQFFTSRGWAWLDVNYGGSSGYGRKYIERLVGNWGIVDVQDCIEATRILSNGPNALIDAKRTVIRGGSSGGFAVLAALANGPDVTTFAAGTSLYGICNLKLLVSETHKFESYYLFKLIGGTFDEVPEVYEARSPINHAEKIVSPLLILQGDIDKVVPKTQAELMYGKIKERDGIVEYKLYPGEGHGWRQSQTMIDALERELRFYEEVLHLKQCTA